jgi:hypothetical protein
VTQHITLTDDYCYQVQHKSLRRCSKRVNH